MGDATACGVALAAISRQVGQQIIHGGIFGHVDQRPAFPAKGHQAGIAQMGEMERQSRRGQAQAFPDPAGRHPFGSRPHQQSEHIEAGFVGEGSQGGDDIRFLHISTLVEKWSVVNLVAGSAGTLRTKRNDNAVAVNQHHRAVYLLGVGAGAVALRLGRAPWRYPLALTTNYALVPNVVRPCTLCWSIGLRALSSPQILQNVTIIFGFLP